MRKTLTENKSKARNGMRILAAVALTGSLALFGCTTNRTPGYGEPGMSNPAAGAMAPNATSTPGSANTMGTMPGGVGPQAMISSSPANGESASVDALATIKADQAYRGRVLGPAAPGNSSVMPLSMQQTTGQFISPSLYANPQVTVNSSLSSVPTPAVVSGAGGSGGAGAVGVTAGAAVPVTSAGATLGTAATLGGGAITSNAALNGVQNVGVTGVSSATATPITNVTSGVALTPAGSATLANPALATNNQVIGTGMANAPAAASNVVATPLLTSVGAVGQLNAATGASVLGVTNVAPLASSATPTVAGTTAAANMRAQSALPTVSGTTGAATNRGNLTASLTNNATTTGTSATATANATTTTTAAKSRLTLRGGTTGGSATAGLRVMTAPNGAIVVTNQSGTALNQFVSGVRARATSAGPQK